MNLLPKKRGAACLVTKADQDSSKFPGNYSLPFHILQEENYFILVHKEKPFWFVTNEVGKEIAVRYYLKNSLKEISEFIKNRFRPSEEFEKDIKKFIDNLDRTGFFRAEFQAERPDSIPSFKGILFLATHACNLSCFHCSVERTPGVPPRISKEIFYEIVDETASLGAENLLISGGEPLLRLDLFELLDYSTRKLKVSLLTNGTLIRQKEAKQLKQLGVSEIVLSLDGASPNTHDYLRGKGNFKRVLNGIDLLINEGLQERINLNFCLSKLNMEEAIDFLKFVENAGVKKVTFLPVKKLGRAADVWEDLKPDRNLYEMFLINLYEMFFHQDFSIKVNFPLGGFHPVVKPDEPISTCPFGTQLIVNGEGDIYTCPALLIPEFHLGNVFDISIEEAIKSSKFKVLKDKYKARMDRITRCRSCIWRWFCQGGCTSTVYLEKGSIWKTDDFCELRDKLYRKAIISAAKKKNLRREDIDAGICSQ